MARKRFATFPLSAVVRYLHALWICECKTCLLSVAKTVKVYDGKTALDLLRRWQLEADTSRVVAFLTRRLDMLPLAAITQQIHQATSAEQRQRLLYGRAALLNRGMNLMQAMDAIFALSKDELVSSLVQASAALGHLPDQIALQLEEMDTPLYSFVPHQLLAQQNMLVMNKLSVHGSLQAEDLSAHRTWHVTQPTDPRQPYAEHVFASYQQGPDL